MSLGKRIHLAHFTNFFALYHFRRADEIDDEVQVAFDDDGETKDSRNRSSQEPDTEMSETQRRRRGKTAKGIKEDIRPTTNEKEQASVMDQLYSFWSVVTFSWMRPLLVVGTSSLSSLVLKKGDILYFVIQIDSLQL